MFASFLSQVLCACHYYYARTHARLGSTMPLTYHDWLHPVLSSLVYVSLRKVDDVLA